MTVNDVHNAEYVVPLDEIKSVTIPTWVLCEVPACGWCTPNSRGSFDRYCEHVRTHTEAVVTCHPLDPVERENGA